MIVEQNNPLNENGEMKRFSRRDALRIFGGAGLGMFLTTAANPVSIDGQTKEKSLAVKSAQNINLQGNGFYRFKVGELECFVVSDGVINAPPPMFAANVPKAEADNALRDYFLSTNQLALQVNTLLVRSGDKTVLIDTGSGANLGPTTGQLITNLAHAGFPPEAITDVVFTHAHGDHAGGNTDAAGKIAFPNARFHISQNEWETWTAKNVNLRQTRVDEQTRKFYIELAQKNLLSLKDRIQIFKPGAEIVTGVSSVAAVGHTPGHTAYLIASGNESVLHAGDFAHHFAFQIVHPEWFTAVDFEPQQAVATRKKLLDRAAADRTLITGSHMPFPGVGHIRARNQTRTSYEWIPVEWQW